MTNKIFDLSILQWNMGDSVRSKDLRPNSLKRAEILSNILRINKPTIVTLQEAKRDVLLQSSLTEYDTLYGQYGIVTLIRKSQLYHISHTSLDKRAHCVVTNNSNNRHPLFKIINVHFPALFKNEDEKREYIRDFIGKAESWRVLNDPRLEIISGDFNLPPYDEVMIFKSGFNSNRDIGYVHEIKSKKIGKAVYNSSWKIFGGDCGSLGTYYHTSQPHGPWHIPDQIMLDPRIVKDNLVDVKILTRIDKISLTKRNSDRPSMENASDHFPLLVTAKIPFSQTLKL